jgi:universal stress protein A
MQSIQRILCPIDFSDCSRAALSAAFELKQRQALTLDVLHAYSAVDTGQPDLVVSATIGPDVLCELLAAEQAEAMVREFLRSFGRELARDLNVFVVQQEPLHAILSHVAQFRHDLIVMGTHGRAAVAQLHHGSVAESVIRRAPCRVLVVHSEQFANASNFTATERPTQPCPAKRISRIAAVV